MEEKKIPTRDDLIDTIIQMLKEASYTQVVGVKVFAENYIK